MRGLLLILFTYLLSSTAPGASAGALEQTIHARLALMKDVAHAKWVTGRPIEDLAREQVVIEQAVISGLQFRLTPAATTRFFTAQIEAAKAIQRYWFTVWATEPPNGPAPELGTQIRPRLLVLGDQILAELGTQPEVESEATFIQQTRLDGLPGDYQIALYQSLRSLAYFTSPLDQIRESRILRVGTTLDYAPFSYVNANGERQGFDIELAEQLAHGLGARIHWVETSWPTLMRDFSEGKFDIGMSGISIIPARAEQAYFSLPYHTGGKTPISRCETAQHLASLEAIDQPSVKVIVNPGGTNERYVRQHVTRAEIMVHPSNRTIFDALLEGQADVMITDAIEVAVMTSRYPTLCATMPGQRLSEQDKGILMPKSYALRAWIDDHLDALLSDGTLKALMHSAIKRAADPTDNH